LPDGKVKTGAAAHEPLSQPDHVPVHDDRAPGKQDTRLAAVDMSARGTNK